MSEDYTVGVRVEGFSNKHLHMTIAYVGKCNDEKLEKIKTALQNLHDDVFPLHVTFTKDAMFGPKNDIPVRLCTVPEKANDKLVDFYKSFGVPDNNHVTEQVLHVSKRNSEEEINKSSGFISRTIFLKRIGPYDPIFDINC